MRLNAGRQSAKSSAESAGFLTLWPTKKRTDSPPKACRYRAATAPLSLRRLEPGCARRDDARERNQRADIPVSNSRRHGPPIANQAPHRHRQANSGTCRGREPPPARHTFEVLPPETRPHKIDLSGRKSWCESDDPAFAAKAADIVRLYMAWPRARLHGGDDLVLGSAPSLGFFLEIETRAAAERLRRISPTAAGSIARDHVAHSDIAAL